MKKFLTMLSLVLLGFASTSCYDDSKLWEKVEDLDVRVETLETLCTQMNSNLTALTELINAMTMGDVIVGVTPIKDNGVEIGWQILLKDREPVVIYHGKNGAAGADGKDGVNGTNGQDAEAPVFGVKEDTDGFYYWTLDGEFVVDAEGNKLPVTAAAPKVKVENETWMVSYDDGKTWTELGPAVTVGIKDVEYTDDVLILTMNDGTKINVKIGSGFKVVLREFDATALQYGSDLEIPYTIEGAEGEVVVFLLQEGSAFKAELVEESALAGKVVVKQLAAETKESKGKVGIFAVAEDGTTVSQAVRLTSGVFTTVEGNKDTYAVAPVGGKVVFTVATNALYKVNGLEECDWITYIPPTKAVENKGLTFNVRANAGNEARNAAVEVVSGALKLGFTITQEGGFSLAGTYKFKDGKTVGGKDGSTTAKGLIEQYGGWDPVKASVNSMKDDKFTFTATGVDANGNETGTVTFDKGADGKTWNYKLLDNMNNNKEYDGTEMYCIFSIEGTTNYVFDATAGTVTLSTDGREYVVDLLAPASYKYSGVNVTVKDCTFGFHLDLGYTEARVANYSSTSNGFSRHYVWARDHVFLFVKE